MKAKIKLSVPSGTLPERLKKICTDEHLSTLSQFLAQQTVTVHLGLNEDTMAKINAEGKSEAVTPVHLKLFTSF